MDSLIINPRPFLQSNPVNATGYLFGETEFKNKTKQMTFDKQVDSILV